MLEVITHAQPNKAEVRVLSAQYPESDCPGAENELRDHGTSLGQVIVATAKFTPRAKVQRFNLGGVDIVMWSLMRRQGPLRVRGGPVLAAWSSFRAAFNEGRIRGRCAICVESCAGGAGGAACGCGSTTLVLLLRLLLVAEGMWGSVRRRGGCWARRVGSRWSSSCRISMWALLLLRLRVRRLRLHLAVRMLLRVHCGLRKDPRLLLQLGLGIRLVLNDHSGEVEERLLYNLERRCTDLHGRQLLGVVVALRAHYSHNPAHRVPFDRPPPAPASARQYAADSPAALRTENTGDRCVAAKLALGLAMMGVRWCQKIE
ncbi:hypothetical protein C8J57DRAFT_1549627 [Mycena rebaudengoi]|nr:hypothetical protein C8J57DRAFT_1549627 [Mycena rebaudengoi]